MSDKITLQELVESFARKCQLRKIFYIFVQLSKRK